MENGGRISWEKKRSSVSIYAEKTMHQIMLRDLKFLRYWWSCLACVTFCWFALHETLILLSCCVFIEMVDCLNTIILKSFVIIVFTSILHLFYRTNTTQNMYQTLFFISREFSILILVTSCICNAIHVTIRAKYKKLNYNKIRPKKTLKMISCRVIPKVSQGITLHFIEIHPNFHMSYGILLRKYKNVMNTL
jgi:hypothetical protein